MSRWRTELLDKITKRNVKVAVIGLGYVGHPLAMAFTCAGLRTHGVDKDVEKVREKVYPTTTDLEIITAVDCVIICLPTPLNSKGIPNLSYIIGISKQISEFLKPGQLVILESSVYPGATDSIVRPWLEEHNGLVVGEDVFLGYSPEREDIGRPEHDVTTMPKVVSGATPACLELVSALYGLITKTVPVSSIKTAEMAKMLENTFRLVNISLMNELKMFTQKMGIDIFEVVSATKTRPFGYMPFYPSAGAGGDCVPVDPQYLAWKMKEEQIPSMVLENAISVNNFMPIYTCLKLTEALGGGVKDKRILVLGLAYKANVSDHRNSAGHALMKLLHGAGATVHWSDPHIKYSGTEFIKSRISLISTLQTFDAVIIVVRHSAFNISRIVKYSKIVIDTCNATKGMTNKNIFPA